MAGPLVGCIAGTVRPNTLSGYRQYAKNYIEPDLGDKRISQIASGDIQKMYTKLKQEGRIHNHPQYVRALSNAMRNRIHAMQAASAASIDRGIGKAGSVGQRQETSQTEKPAFQPFVPYRRKTRKPGAGCISQISEHCWEGRYSPMWPDGKKHARNVYAKTREKCEALLLGLIIMLQRPQDPLYHQVSAQTYCLITKGSYFQCCPGTLKWL